MKNYTLLLILMSGLSLSSIAQSNNSSSQNTVSGCTVSIASIHSTICQGLCDGQLDAMASGSAPITYQWSSGETTASINNLCAGTYTVMISDNSGCVASANATVSVDILNLSLTITNTTCAGCADGSVDVVASGQNPPFMYYIVPGTQTIPPFINLTADDYQVCVVDGLNCTSCDLAIVADDPTGIDLAENNSVNFTFDGRTNTINISGLINEQTYSITNIEGKSIATGKISSIQNQIQVAELKSGIYFISLSTNNKRQFKFIKE